MLVTSEPFLKRPPGCTVSIIMILIAYDHILQDQMWSRNKSSADEGSHLSSAGTMAGLCETKAGLIPKGF